MNLHLFSLLSVANVPFCDAFISRSLTCVPANRCKYNRQRTLEVQASESGKESTAIDASSPQIQLRLAADTAVGIHNTELPSVLNAVSSVCEEFGIPFEHDNIQSDPSTLHPETLPGALGRVLLIHVHGVPNNFDVDETELISQIKIYASEQIDNVLSDGEEHKQPILLAFRNAYSDDSVEDVILKEVSDYGLRDAIGSSVDQNERALDDVDQSTFLPSQRIEIDGALVQTIHSPGDTHFDTSSIIVFDNLVSPSLRKRLLNVVKGNAEESNDDWDEAKYGPNSNRWQRGGLVDVVNHGESEESNPDGTCWGLSDDAIDDICFSHHPAISEFESELSQVFSDFVVSRLPEAVFGDCISPLTANAPTQGDTFHYHIDADPLQVPPSPWADVFGRYPNRSVGKPRFVSCLLYLNDKWEPEWGAPTRFLDPPTQLTIDIMPMPGRCVIMDQDISHTVVPPTIAAGKRPRYSLVWKLILHPKNSEQNMKELSCGKDQFWPDPIVVGSAQQ